MVGTRAATLIVTLLLVGLTPVACGGRSRGSDVAVELGGTAGAAPSMPGGRGGSTSEPDPVSCAPMDARSGGELCGGIPGYAWNGSVCEALHCNCRGSACDHIYPNANDCDRAFNACYERAGLQRSCKRHSDCALQLRTCCGPCVPPPGSILLGAQVGSPRLRLTSGCSNVACDDCVTPASTTAYPVCIDGLCGVYDVTDQAACQTDADCRLITKDCCDCGGDFTFEGVMAVNADVPRPECAGVGCDGCIPAPPEGLYGWCHDVSALRSDAVRVCEVAISPK